MLTRLLSKHCCLASLRALDCFGKANTDAKLDFGFSRKFKRSCYDSAAELQEDYLA